jgi:energy-coupling factor transport system permease protein
MLFRNIPIGAYFPSNSLFHNLQARTKLLILVWLVPWLIVANHREWHFLPYIVLVALICSVVAFSRIPPREIWRRTWLILIIFALSALPLLSATNEDPKIFTALGPLITTYGLARVVLLVGGAIFAALFLSSLLPVPALRAFWRRRSIRWLRVVSLLLTVAACVTFWLIGSNPGAQALSIGPYVITYGGVWTLLSGFLVLFALLIFSMLLTMTTSPVALIEGLTMLLAPLRRLKLPVDDFALMSLLALRFIPTVLEEAEQLYKAQSSRGADLTSGTLRERFQSLSMLFVPLVQGSLRRAADLAVALEARGYEVEGRQTLLHETTLAAMDYVVMGVIVGVTAISLLP